MKKAFMRALVCALCGALAFSGVNIPSSVAESNTKEMNQMDEKYVVASYPNVLNLPSDKIDRMTEGSFIPSIDNLERLLWICLKINGKITLLLDSVDTSLCKHICPQRYAPDLNSSDKG